MRTSLTVLRGSLAAAVLVMLALVSCSARADGLDQRIRGARLPATPLEQLRVYARDADWQVRAEVASNRRTPQQVLHALARDTDQRVRTAVATNLSTAPATFMVLVHDHDVAVRRIVARFEYVPPGVLDVLAQDPDLGVRIEVARNLNTAARTLRRMVRQESGELRVVAEQMLLEKQ